VWEGHPPPSGWTENAGPENGGPKKMKDMRMQDLKMNDHRNRTGKWRRSVSRLVGKLSQ